MVLTTRPFWSGEAQFAAVRNTHIKPNVSLEPTFSPEWIISKPQGCSSLRRKSICHYGFKPNEWSGKTPTKAFHEITIVAKAKRYFIMFSTFFCKGVQCLWARKISLEQKASSQCKSVKECRKAQCINNILLCSLLFSAVSKLWKMFTFWLHPPFSIFAQALEYWMSIMIQNKHATVKALLNLCSLNFAFHFRSGRCVGYRCATQTYRF